MDLSEYMPMFLAESREHLQDLNLAVVALENDPSHRETVDQIFRIAHSLKGMTATMGFSQMAALTHEMEEVFELLRQRADGLSQEAVDAVLDCLDALSGAVDAIEDGGGEQLDPALLIDRLGRLVRRTTATTRVLRVAVTLDADTLMPAVRAHMVLAALGEHGAITSSLPGGDDLDGFTGREIEAWLASDQAPEEISEAVARVSDVVKVEVTEDAGTRDAPADMSAEVVTGDRQAVALTAASPAPTTAHPGIPALSAPGGHHNAATVRVDADRLDQLMHLMGEVVIHRTAVEAQTQGLTSPALHTAVQNLTRSSQALQSMVMQVRMIPVDVVFVRFPRLVRDLATRLGKTVELSLVGADTELDRTVVDALGDPLVHLVRNSLDHGLESPEERVGAGKPATGSLTIAAAHAGSNVLIEVRDDGRGIDPLAVATKAAAVGLIEPEQITSTDMRAAIELLFTPGFSTAETTSEISGRGVGMDAVRDRIRELGGDVIVDSTPGVGTSAQIRLPLTLAIIPTLQVEIAGDPYAVPIDRIERALRLSEQSVRSVAGRRMLALGDGIIPLLDGAAAFGQEPTGSADLLVVLSGLNGRFGLIVDELIGQRELVTRPLPPIISDGLAVSGGAVLADGRIALIVDCDVLISSQGAS